MTLTLRICSVCKTVEIKQDSLIPLQELEKMLTKDSYELTHGILSRDCATKFYGKDLVENIKFSYERCEVKQDES